MQADYTVNNLAELAALAQELVAGPLQTYRKVFLDAPMGAGKTTLVHYLLQALGGQEEASSPSYSLINEYGLQDSPLLVRHADLYRLDSLEEALEIGIEDYLEDEHFFFVEWPEILLPLLAENALHLRILVQEEGKRQIFLEKM